MKHYELIIEENQPTCGGRTPIKSRILEVDTDDPDAIAIKERYNPRCRMGHMPKRYWANMTEFWEERCAERKEQPDFNQGGLTLKS